MNKYDKLYQKSKFSRGLKPNTLTTIILKYTSEGSVLDLGCGEGQDAVFLAKRGFDVTAIDNSKTAIEHLKELAKENKVSIKTKLCDIEKYEFKQEFDVVLAEASLHFLTKEKRKEVISLIKNITKKDGLNIVGVFDTRTTKKETKELRKWGIKLFSEDELLKYYKDWKILLYKQFFDKRENQEKRGITQIIANNSPVMF